MTNWQCIKKQRHCFTDKSSYSQTYELSSSHVWVWELDYKESWVPKNWCFWIAVLEKTLESPLDCKEIQPVNKGNQSWIFIRRTYAEAEIPILWPPDAKNRLIRKDPDCGKDWRQEEKGMTEDEMVGWHHQGNGHEFEQAPRVDEGKGSLICCSLWGRKSQTQLTEWLNWTVTCLALRKPPNHPDKEEINPQKVKPTAQGHPVGLWQSEDLNLDSLGLEPTLLMPT